MLHAFLVPVVGLGSVAVYLAAEWLWTHWPARQAVHVDWSAVSYWLHDELAAEGLSAASVPMGAIGGDCEPTWISG